MKIAVFGAAGWLGRAILSNLIGLHEVRALDLSSEAWDYGNDLDGEWNEGEKVYGDISDFGFVDDAIEGIDAVIHAAVYASQAPGAYDVDDDLPYLVNLKGLRNVLESSRQRKIGRVVHVGSCQVVHPDGVFFDADVRRPDGSLYAVTKRLQEEMCRQYHDAFRLPIIVLRPCSIIDSRLGIGKSRKKLGNGGTRRDISWVCRHDLAEACRLSAENRDIGFDILHTVGTVEAEATCNVRQSRKLLGLEYRGDLDQYDTTTHQNMPQA